MDRSARVSTRSLAAGALIGLATFPVAGVVLNIVQSAHYDALTQPMSQLALSTDGWLLTIAFCTFGVGLLLLALIMRRTVPGARALRVMFALAGILNFVAAAFPTDAKGSPASAHGTIHNISGLATFVLLVVAMVVAGFSFRTSAQWRSFSRPTFVWSGFVIAGFISMFVLWALHLFGLGQRIAVGTWLVWLLAVAWRAMRSADHERVVAASQAGARS